MCTGHPSPIGVYNKHRKVANNHECFSGYTLKLVYCGCEMVKKISQPQAVKGI